MSVEEEPFDFTTFLSRRQGLSLEDAHALLATWMREQFEVERRAHGARTLSTDDGAAAGHRSRPTSEASRAGRRSAPALEMGPRCT
jgi:hypothetical protein